MPLYVGDYLADTRHLSTEEHGAYLLLIMHYWRTGGLPDNDAQLARIAGLTLEGWGASRNTIAAFFEEGWKHKRIEKELADAERLSAAGRAGGLASGKARSNDKRTTVERPLNDLRTIGQAPQSQPQPQSHLQAKSSFKGVGEVKRGWTPPRHGATGKGRIYIEARNPDWQAYASDFEAAHGYLPKPNEHGGKWFKVLGEQSPDQQTLRGVRAQIKAAS